ncbi:MAG: aryl-sulfate sulfotransferase [Campylobacteraceae bacterium]|jgi:arylsulfate sulfotransferase|nr:aryl-sulfate sulfotransferase [Campylobacteraceae bacterium]
MSKRKVLSSAIIAGLILSASPVALFAAGGGSGTVTHKGEGKIGAVFMNPFDLSPLTAVIKNGGYKLTNVKVVVEGKDNGGIPISYDVSDSKILLYGGIPVWGMYPDYVNKVNVSYTLHNANGNSENIKELYTIYAPPVALYGSGTKQKRVLPDAKVVVAADKSIKKDLYLMNHLSSTLPNAAQVVWNYPSGGAIEWDYETYVWIIDTNGDIRWYLDTSKLRDTNDLRKKGNLMGFDQTADGALMWGMSQAYMKYDLMGRQIFHRMLPKSYVDFSHHLEETSKGTYLLRVGSSDYKRKDDKNVRTVRDVIVEIDKDGNVLDEWKLMEILDPYRDVNMLAMDQGAVCLNIDAAQAGQTKSKEELEDANAPFGDVAGVGAGRNWAHVNSVNYDANDDSIIISSRHQSAVIKIGRDKKVKWILSSPEGWTGELAKKVLTPVDEKGRKIDCGENGSKCPGYLNEKGGFDWSWTQHTAYVIPEKSKKGVSHVSVFDNGDSRGMEQPAIVNMKYSRAVEYVVDEKKMTVKQVWEFGKERGFEWFSPITSVVEYMPKTDSMMVYSATAGLGDVKAFSRGESELVPFLHEFKYGTKQSLLEIKFIDSNTIGYRALKVDLNSAFK